MGEVAVPRGGAVEDGDVVFDVVDEDCVGWEGPEAVVPALEEGVEPEKQRADTHHLQNKHAALGGVVLNRECSERDLN